MKAQRSRTLTRRDFLAGDQLYELFFAPAWVFGRANPNGGVEVWLGCKGLLHGSCGLGFIVFDSNPKPRGVQDAHDDACAFEDTSGFATGDHIVATDVGSHSAILMIKVWTC